jgi:hypothetical protein
MANVTGTAVRWSDVLTGRTGRLLGELTAGRTVLQRLREHRAQLQGIRTGIARQLGQACRRSGLKRGQCRITAEIGWRRYRNPLRGFHPGVGCGLQYFLPVGPAGSGIAFNPDRDPDRDEDRYVVHFGVGWRFRAVRVQVFRRRRLFPSLYLAAFLSPSLCL